MPAKTDQTTNHDQMKEQLIVRQEEFSANTELNVTLFLCQFFLSLHLVRRRVLGSSVQIKFPSTDVRVHSSRTD